MSSTRYWSTVALVLGMSLSLLAVADAAPMPRYNSYSNEVGYYNGVLQSNPEYLPLLEILSRLGQTVMRANEDYENNAKRTVDFGLARGYSGIQEAKHRMGMAAANYAGGPGRRRRAINDA